MVWVWVCFSEISTGPIVKIEQSITLKYPSIYLGDVDDKLILTNDTHEIIVLQGIFQKVGP